ncbi:MAG: hypothetical protein M1389_11730 [Chloroflexi bacterium]|nr:hypothetical protein [Chloroflexota bacterium]
MPNLTEIARRTGFPFEASPSGRWVRFITGGEPVYVVEGAWGNSYLVWAGADAESANDPTASESVETFLRPEEAVTAVLRRVRAADKAH